MATTVHIPIIDTSFDTMKNELSKSATISMIEAPTKLIPQKPMRPLTAYHIFFQIEREFIIQNIDGEDADKSIHDNKVILTDVPDRYKNIKLMPDWYFGPGKRQKRKHRKSHGKIGFLELSRVISSRWADLENLDPKVKKFVQGLADQELAEYQREMKEYKELTKDITIAGAAKAVTESVSSSTSSSPSSSPSSSSGRKSKGSRSSSPKPAATTRRAAAVAAKKIAKEAAAAFKQAQDEDEAAAAPSKRQYAKKSSSSRSTSYNGYVQVPLHSRFPAVSSAVNHPDPAFSAFSATSESIPSFGNLDDEIDRFIDYTNETDLSYGQNDRKRSAPQQQEEDPSSFLSFLDPLLEFQDSNGEINAEDHYFANHHHNHYQQHQQHPQQHLYPPQHYQEQQQIHHHHQIEPVSKKQKQRRLSPSSVVDICDDDIMKLWVSQNIPVARSAV